MAFRAHRAAGQLVACILLGSCAVEVAAQQFVEDSASRFPFPNPTDYTNQLTIGDIDNDGDLDIIFANGGGFSSAGTPEVQRVYINDGTGVFTDQSSARLGFSGLCRGAELGDIDNDGDLDLVFAQDFNRRPALFLNNGLGFFSNVTSARLPAINLGSSRANFADIDNDGDLDLYFVNGGSNRFGCGQFRVYVNNGLGFFTDQTAALHPVGPFCEPMDCIFGDIDGDFDLDIRTAGRGTNNSRLFRNNGSGVFTTIAGVPADNTCYSYDFGDMNGDGDLDLLGANAGPNNTELLLSNDGTGTFTNASSQLQTNPSVDDNDSKFFDYDNDGDLDIIIAALGGASERIYTNNGSGTFTQAANIITAISDSSLDVKVGDVNNDGKLDIVTAQGESGNFQNRIYINFGPADTIAPRIVATEQLADTSDTVNPHVVRAAVLDGMTSDRNFFDRGVFLNYSINGGATTRVSMRYSGGQIYRGLIPGQRCGGTVSYYVTAKDWANNTGTGMPKMFHIAESGPLRFVFNGGESAPNLIAPCTPLTFQVEIQDCAEQFQPGSAILHYQYGLNAGSEPLTALSSTLHEGVLPATTCGVSASYFISAQTLTGQTVYFPEGAPAAPQVLAVGVLEQQNIATEDFESGMPAGWQATGLWGVTGGCTVLPVCEGASWAYCGDTLACNYDAGATDSRLTAPVMVLPQSTDISLSYCSTFHREAFGVTDWPSLLVNGAIVDEPAQGGLESTPWQTRTIDLSSYSGQSVTLQWRFNTIDAFGNDFPGWQIDHVVVSALLPACDSAGLQGDLNGDGSVDGRDVGPFTAAVVAGSTEPEAVCAGDYTGDGQLTMDDVQPFAEALVGE